jgi:uncharacterized protein (DUF924 family)
MALDLSKILTPTLYNKVLAVRFPWEGPVDIAFASKFFFEGIPDSTRDVYDVCYQNALKPISRIVPAIPELAQYLPLPDSPEYPEHTLGLVLLLDQGPRMLFVGMNSRYTNMYFDGMTEKLVKGLFISGILPVSVNRWMSLGYGFEDVMIRIIWFYAPLIHSEDAQNHRLMTVQIEEMRKQVEKYSGKRDPSRDTRKEDKMDTLLFAKLIRERPPSTFAEFFFWVFRVFDAHRPIIEKFGRYPYRNNVMVNISCRLLSPFDC